MMGWAAKRVDMAAVDLVNGQYRATLYAPDTEHMGGYADIDCGANTRLRPLYSGRLHMLPDAVKGDFRRSVHRAALAGLVSEWSGTALALLVHHVCRAHSGWCVWGCPIAALAQQAQQDTQQAG